MLFGIRVKRALDHHYAAELEALAKRLALFDAFRAIYRERALAIRCVNRSGELGCGLSVFLREPHTGGHLLVLRLTESLLYPDPRTSQVQAGYLGVLLEVLDLAEISITTPTAAYWHGRWEALALLERFDLAEEAWWNYQWEQGREPQVLVYSAQSA